jgi:Family of unknown function (DUF6807)
MRGVGIVALGALLGAGCKATPEPAPEEPPRPEAATHGDVIRVEFEGELMAEIHPDASPKPYIYPLCAPGGIPVTRGFPMEELEGEAQDHPHHQSMWFAHGDVNGFDFWHGTESQESFDLLSDADPTHQPGTQLMKGFLYDWTTADQGVIATEWRMLTFERIQDANVIDASFAVSPSSEPIIFGDTKEGTFALRLHPQLRVEGEVAAGHLRNSEGLLDGEAWGKRARWLNAYGTIDGEHVGVAIFDHPENPRHPTWWHARKYGLLAANPFGAHDFEKAAAGTGDFEVASGGTLQLRYRVLVYAGEWSAERVEAAYQRWASRSR